MKIKNTMMERACQHDVAKTALALALYGYATDPDLADRQLEIVLEYYRRCDKDHGLRIGERVYRRETSTYRAELIRATKRQFKPDYVHTERAVFRALAYAFDPGLALDAALGCEEPEPTYPAVTIMSDPATQTIQ
jgi:hypothetical protein